MTTSSITSSPDEPIAFHQQNGSSRRPVGIVIRHSPTILATSSSLSGEIDIDGGGMSRGLFGLLNSISSIRQGSMIGNLHNPDALSNAQFEQFLHHILMNESSHSGAPPASENVIESLQKVTMEQESNIASYGECCISQEPFEIGDVVVCLPCGHNYKEEPIVHWLKMHNTCPVCRVKIDTNSNIVSTSTTSTIS
jgi:E3 ubiquitin-protein ligase RNF115/126